MNKPTSIGMIGGADGPTAIVVAGHFPWLAVGVILAVILSAVVIIRKKRKK